MPKPIRTMSTAARIAMAMLSGFTARQLTADRGASEEPSDYRLGRERARESGMGGPDSQQLAAEVEGATLASLFLDTVAAHGPRVALRAADGSSTYTFAEYADRVARLATGLRARGVRRGDRVLVMFRNVPEFHLLDLAVTFCGATPVSIYNSSAPEQIAYLGAHCEATLAVVESSRFSDAIAEARPDLPALRGVGAADGSADFTFAELLAHEPADLEAAAAVDVLPSDLATVIYTSGTTGPPKGVMITQRNLLYTVALLRHALQAVEKDPTGYRTISYLPMAHIAERLTTHYSGIASAYEVTCLPELASLAATLREVRPQLFLGVPRVWEKLHNGLLAALAADPAKRELFEAGMHAAMPIVTARDRGTATEQDLATLAFLDENGFAPVRAMLGLDELHIAITSAAPIAAELVTWFRALGVPLTELYGMSESSGPMTWEGKRPIAGSVGKAIPGCEVRLADDGEIICRGGNVFAGYLKDPQKTAEAIDADGWLHSGDIGTIDADGYLHIVDRKKELIITAGGKNISPANLEAKLKLVPLVGQACAIGDGKPYMSALLVLDPDQARAFAEREGLADTSLAAVAAHPAAAALVEHGVAEAMEEFNNAERVKRWVILGVDWLPDSEELTPTSKLKRRNIATKYAAEIASMYD
jgi:long-chain acyl-CoA synthetase